MNKHDHVPRCPVNDTAFSSLRCSSSMRFMQYVPRSSPRPKGGKDQQKKENDSARVLASQVDTYEVLRIILSSLLSVPRTLGHRCDCRCYFFLCSHCDVHKDIRKYLSIKRPSCSHSNHVSCGARSGLRKRNRNHEAPGYNVVKFFCVV